MDDPSTPRVLLVRGGALTPYSGLGGAFHDLRTALDKEEIGSWRSAGVEEYDLGPRPSAIKRLVERWWNHPRRVKSTIRRLRRQGGLNLVHISDQEQAHLVPRRSPVPVVVYVHDFFHLYPSVVQLGEATIEVGDHRPSTVRKADLRRLRRGLNRADGFICNTGATADMCRKLYPGKPLYQIPYALDLQRFAPPVTLPQPPDELKPTTCHLLVVGSHDPRKRLSFLVSLLGRLPEDIRNDLMVHHIGSQTCPNGGPTVSALAQACGVPWTYVGGDISDETLNAYRWHCETLLFPSAAEGFGYPPVESMAAGQPVLASAAPAHVELMPEGTCLPAADAEAWISALTEVHAAWKGRDGKPRQPRVDLMKHVAFLAPERFNEDMAAAWATLAA